MVQICCLHTAESNVTVFERALREIGATGVKLSHHVRADLLAEARRVGLSQDLAERTKSALLALCRDADVVLLTCSTLGPAAEIAAESASIPILRVDAALAHRAVGAGGRVVVLCAAATTLEPTRLLFEAAARGTDAEIVIKLVPEAWAAFEAGEGELYLNLIAEAAESAAQEGASRVALAQASMACAAERTRGVRPLTSPGAGLAAAIGAAAAVQS